jgi:hypothetical protein
MGTATKLVSAQTSLAVACLGLRVVDPTELCLSLPSIGIQAESS